jgi:hypothetical protein
VKERLREAGKRPGLSWGGLALGNCLFLGQKNKNAFSEDMGQFMFHQLQS